MAVTEVTFTMFSPIILLITLLTVNQPGLTLPQMETVNLLHLQPLLLKQLAEVYLLLTVLMV